MDKVLFHIFCTIVILSVFVIFACIYLAIWTDVDAKMIEETGLTTLLFGVVSFVLAAILVPTEKGK